MSNPDRPDSPDRSAAPQRAGTLLPGEVQLSVCAMCTDTTVSGEEGIGGGARLQRMLRDLLADSDACDAVQIKAYRCLMACSDGCVVAFAQPGKMQYLLGRLPASEGKARELVEFAEQYAASPSGIVPNHQWPGTLGFHFLGRLPPLEPSPDVDWAQQLESCDL